MDINKAEAKWILAVEWLAVIAIIILATYLRYWRIEEVPPGFNSDEAVGAIGALTTLREGIQYSYEGQGGGGALGFYFATVAFYLFGPSIASIRGLAAWAGVVSIFVNYWAIREVFRISGLKRARWIAFLSTLGLSVSLWHVSASRIAFAGIGVPFLMLPSVYFLWYGLNKSEQLTINDKKSLAFTLKSLWPFILSGIFLGGLMYIYLSGAFVPPLYAAFFITQWLLVKIVHRFKAAHRFKGVFKFKWEAEPAQAYMTSQFWQLFASGVTAVMLMLPLIYVLFFNRNLDPGSTRVSQAFFLNPQINQGDPWGLLWRSIGGNLGAYGVSLSWFMGQSPRLSLMTSTTGLMVFLGFLISLWYVLRGKAAYLFMVLWYVILLLPSILSPDQIPHNLRTIGATTPTYTFVAIFIVWLFEMLWLAGRRWVLPSMGQTRFGWLARGVGVAVGVFLGWQLYQAHQLPLYRYFYIFPETNDAKAAYHVYAVDMAEEIKRESNADVAFILPRNTAAGDVFRNFTTDFLVELEPPPAAHYWVIDNEATLAADLTLAAADHTIIRVVQWKTSKHTGADPKKVIPYYLEKYGDYSHSDSFEYFDIHTYQLETPAPNFESAETLQASDLNFGDMLRLRGYAVGDAGKVSVVNETQASSNDKLWLRLAWQQTQATPENMKVSALIFNEAGQLLTQVDKALVNNGLQVKSSEWSIGEEAETYFLIDIPPATPPGNYTLAVAVYGEETLNRVPVSNVSGPLGGAERLAPLTDFTVTPAQKSVIVADLDLAFPARQELLPGLTLLGFESLPGETVRSGELVKASIIWQAGDTALNQDLAMAFVVRAGEGKDEWTLSEPVGLAGDHYPSLQWQPGEVLRGWLSARIPPSYKPGLYKLSLRLSEVDKPEAEVLSLPIGDFEVQGWQRNFDAPQPQITLDAAYGGLATLVGLDAASAMLSPGETLKAQLYWRVDDEFEQDYTVFVQLIGPDGVLWGQVDQTPGVGLFPTTGWLPGEYITDVYAITLAEDAPLGEYQIAIGLYDPSSGQRLPVTSPDCQPDVCLLPGLRVE